MLPSRGQCHGVFLLCRVAQLRHRRDLDEWISAARAQSTFMAHALDFERIASGLIENGLASLLDRVVVNAIFSGLSDQADRTTLLAIARILIQRNPPFWLNVAVNNLGVSREYIPSKALEQLQWIEPGLDQFLIDIQASTPIPGQDALRERIGEVAELFILAALEYGGANPVHVSKLSDSYGYDIECRGENIDRVEVKAASVNTQECFHLSRNEFDKSVVYAERWKLIQVVFSNRAFVENHLDVTHVELIRQLRSGALRQLVPSDTKAFRWTESALITVPQDMWVHSHIQLDPDFVTAGFFNPSPALGLAI